MAPAIDIFAMTPSPFTVDLVEYNCAKQFMMASKARLFGDDTALSAILASATLKSKNASDVRCATSTLHYGKTKRYVLPA